MKEQANKALVITYSEYQNMSALSLGPLEWFQTQTEACCERKNFRHG